MNKEEFITKFYSCDDEEQFLKDVYHNLNCLRQENKQLKIQISAREEEYKKLEDNWNKLKELIDVKLYNTEYLQKLCGCRIDDEIHIILDIIKKEMKELEGSDSNVKK